MYMSRKEMPPREHLSEKNLSLIGVPRLFFKAEIEDYTGVEVIQKVFKEYINDLHSMFEECVNITLLGKNGNGKTFLTSIVLKNAYRYHYSAKRITFSSFIALCFSKKKTDIEYMEIDTIHNAEFLVIDEIGKEVSLGSGANVSLLEELLKYREEKGYPTLICTNLSMELLQEKYGNTIVSLFTQSLLIQMEGDDERKERFNKREAVERLDKILQEEEEE